MVEELLSGVDQPLKVITDKSNNKYYLCCDYNRDGDSYRFAVLSLDISFLFIACSRVYSLRICA